ncbi:ankyrin repeat domain-containing protein [Microbulbifer echini]|uniref:Ankyrin repeat domain-containing protein n=1 Tax=Microbulbifer echini TaxID=1529067 RepID=A0ABV4NUH1_9GAMM
MRDIEIIFREIENVPDFTGHNIDSLKYTNGYGDTPLHIVSSCGKREASGISVSAGANVDAIGESGFTPLDCAAEQNKPDGVVFLRRLGAKTIHDSGGETPLELAFSLGNKEAVNARSQSI